MKIQDIDNKLVNLHEGDFGIEIGSKNEAGRKAIQAFNTIKAARNIDLKRDQWQIFSTILNKLLNREREQQVQKDDEFFHQRQQGKRH